MELSYEFDTVDRATGADLLGDFNFLSYLTFLFGRQQIYAIGLPSKV